MHPLRRRQLRRRERAAAATQGRREFDPASGIYYCARLPVSLLEPICERVSRVHGDSFNRLVHSIEKHGLANPLLTVSELPAPNFSDWREWRYRFLYTIAAPIKVVTGHNRYAAVQVLGWTHVPVLHSGAIPESCLLEDWVPIDSLEEAQRYCRDGKIGLGPYSLVMDHFTPPLKGVPAGFEA